MITRRAIRLLLVVLVPSILLGQGSRTGSPVTGDIQPIVFQPGAAETNVIFATLGAGIAGDDNNNNSLTHPIAGTQYFADPSVAIQETRKHLAWDLSYSPSLRVYVPGSSQSDVFNQSFGGALHYDVTKRLGIGLRQDYLRTSDPFEQLGGTPLQTGVGLGFQQGAGFLSDVKRTELLSQAGIDYRLAKHTTVGLDGAFQQLHGDQLGAQNTTLIDTHDTLGSAFLSQQLTARQTVGVQYEFLDILFPGQDVRTRTHGVLLFDQMALSPRMNVSVFAGPEYSQIHNQVLLNIVGIPVKIPISSTLWSPFVGGSFEWRSERLGLLASFVRRVSDGVGLLGAVEMNDAVLRLKRRFGQRWIADAGGDMTRDTLLNQPGIDPLEVLELGAGVHYALREHLWIRADYQRLHHIGGYQTSVGGSQTAFLPENPFLFGNHNRVTLGIERNFTLPIGR
jgi:hypothetical protein